MKSLSCCICLALINIILIAFSHANPVQTSLSSTTTTTPAGEDDFSEDDLKELEEFVSPKLFAFLQRLAKIDPQLIETGENKLSIAKLMGKDEMDEIIANGDPNELKQFRSDLAKVSKLIAKYPEAKRLVAISVLETESDNIAKQNSSSSSSTVTSTSSPTRVTITTSSASPNKEESFFEDIDPFFDEFTKVDKELSKYPEWNSYWTYWFRRYGDYMAKYG